jgi:hypothetical protein
MTESNDAAGQRDRSPAFPVIALEPALVKLAEFENHYKRTPARPEKVGEAWNIKTKSYADRIAAALRYFGLLEYQGSGKDRGVVLSESGRKFLRAQQDELKREIVKAAALRPKQIAKHWTDWGADRPADAACLDALMEEGFSDGGARDFLKVYDATITYAKLSDSDKIDPEQSNGDEDEGEAERATLDPVKTPADPPPHIPQGKVKVMDGERIVFTEESNPQNYLKLIASGDVDETMLEALEDYVKRQKKRLVNAYQAGVAQLAASGKKPPSSFLGQTGEIAAAQVPFMITNAQKQQLSELGYKEDVIRNMTPTQAHEAIAGHPWNAK